MYNKQSNGSDLFTVHIHLPTFSVFRSLEVFTRVIDLLQNYKNQNYELHTCTCACFCWEEKLF